MVRRRGGTLGWVGLGLTGSSKVIGGWLVVFFNVHVLGLCNELVEFFDCSLTFYLSDIGFFQKHSGFELLHSA
jgi:hypothetical protein